MEPSEKPVIYTIGHGNSSVENFFSLLKQFEIQVVVDIRSMPYSRYVPHFNRDPLSAALTAAGLEYRFAGEFLGGRPKDPSCYKSGLIPQGHANFLKLVDYPAVETKEWYQRGIRRLVQIAQTKRTVVMCSEEDPARCHRQHLIAQTFLNSQSASVLHLRQDGRTQEAWLLPAK